MVNRSLLVTTVILFMTTATLAVWRGPPQMVAALDQETRDWVKGLRNEYGASYCDTADGFPVEVDGWDMAGAVDDTSGMTQLEARNGRSGYRVRLALWQMARCAELRADRSENQQTRLRRGVVMASPKLADLLLPAWVGRLRVKAGVC